MLFFDRLPALGIVLACCPGEEDGDLEASGTEEYLCAKMHLVDLAGSERLDRTQVCKKRFRHASHVAKQFQGQKHQGRPCTESDTTQQACA